MPACERQYFQRHQRIAGDHPRNPDGLDVVLIPRSDSRASAVLANTGTSAPRKYSVHAPRSGNGFVSRERRLVESSVGLPHDQPSQIVTGPACEHPRSLTTPSAKSAHDPPRETHAHPTEPGRRIPPPHDRRPARRATTDDPALSPRPQTRPRLLRCDRRDRRGPNRLVALQSGPAQRTRPDAVPEDPSRCRVRPSAFRRPSSCTSSARRNGSWTDARTRTLPLMSTYTVGTSAGSAVKASYANIVVAAETARKCDVRR